MKKYFKAIIAIFLIVLLSTLVRDLSYQNKRNNVEAMQVVESYERPFDMGKDYATLMAESIAGGDFYSAKRYEFLRNQKKERLGIQDDLTFDNLLLLSKIVHVEAGSSWLTEEHRQLVASVVINRVNSPEFPNTIYEVIHQKGQYATAGTSYFNNLIPSRTSVLSALRVLSGGSIAPPEVVFQSGFKQGGGTYKAVSDSQLGTTYFCYSNNKNLYK